MPGDWGSQRDIFLANTDLDESIRSTGLSHPDLNLIVQYLPFSKGRIFKAEKWYKEDYEVMRKHESVL